jgi:hypothetical protein
MRSTVVVLFAVTVCGACRRSDTDLPPPKTPVRVSVMCEGPHPVGRAPLPAMAPPGRTCGLPQLACDEVRPFVVRVDASGQPIEAFIPGQRSPSLDACLLAEVRSWRVAFEPARECSGEPLIGEFQTDWQITC